MTALEEDSLAVAALGRQHNSDKPSMPAFSFGTGQRDVASKKVFISAKHERCKAVGVSPGPVYAVPSTVGDAPSFGFGSDEQRKHAKAKYPDSSVDLMCATVDTQRVKFHGTKGVHFGTEGRMNNANADIIRVHPTINMGKESPGALEYTPDESKLQSAVPEYSFGPKTSKIGESKPVSRLHLPITGVPRHVGPGSHQQPASMGTQPQSARSSAPSWGFGCAERAMDRKDGKQLLDSAPAFSSLGKQVVSSARSAPQCGFGTSTRDHSARTHLVFSAVDLGPAKTMQKANYHCELPPRERKIAKAGM